MNGFGVRLGVAALAAAAVSLGGMPAAFAGTPAGHGVPAVGVVSVGLAATGSAARVVMRDAGTVCPHAPLDGFSVDWLPDGLGAHLTGFRYEWEDVSFKTRVWQTGPDARGAYRTDLNILVLRGQKLRDIDSLRDFLADYEEKDGHWRLQRFSQDGAPGYVGDDQAFFSPAPGIGVLVKIYDDRFAVSDVLRVAGGMHRLPLGGEVIAGSHQPH